MTSSPYRSTPVFDETTLPSALRANHFTKAGTWAIFRVLSGQVRLHFTDPECVLLLDPQTPGLIEPEAVHFAEPIGAMQMQVEFYDHRPTLVKADCTTKPNAITETLLGHCSDCQGGFSEDDRQMLWQLNEQVAALTQKLPSASLCIDQNQQTDIDCSENIERTAAFKIVGGNEINSPIWLNTDENVDSVNVQYKFPKPEYVRQLIRIRKVRNQYFHGNIFSDPAWDILLDLAAAHGEGKKISVTSLCIASGAPQTTALRWINSLIEEGLLQRVIDEQDRRRSYIALTKNAIYTLSELFDVMRMKVEF